jgi:ammonium transporter Rh
MRVTKCLGIALLTLLATVGATFASEASGGDSLSSVIEVQKYARAIHIMAMLLIGFGFLMVFVKKYGRSAITATYLLVSVAVPLYFLKDSLGIMGGADSDIDRLILAEFSAASLLICAGAVLGRLKMAQYMLLGLLFVPFYALNEWILLEGGLGLVEHGRFVDTGGSIVIHAFGALFGLGVAASMTTLKEFETPIEDDATSDRFSLLGSMVLWVFWPSFCGALVAPADIPSTVVNVIIALCGSTIATYAASLKLRGKVSVADIANAALAGGVAIGSTCDKVAPEMAFGIGVLAGALSTFGFAMIQDRLQNAIKKIDTCGVLQLHGLPGLFGGLIAMVTVSGISQVDQIKGILITIVIAIVSGLIVGKILSLTGRRTDPYTDDEELIVD